MGTRCDCLWLVEGCALCTPCDVWPAWYGVWTPTCSFFFRCLGYPTQQTGAQRGKEVLSHESADGIHALRARCKLMPLAPACAPCLQLQSPRKVTSGEDALRPASPAVDDAGDGRRSAPPPSFDTSSAPTAGVLMLPLAGPLPPISSTFPSPSPSRGPAPAPPSALSAFSWRVLIVDDEMSNRRLCARMLQRLQVGAVTLEDGDEVRVTRSDLFRGCTPLRVWCCSCCCWRRTALGQNSMHIRKVSSLRIL